MPPATTKQLVQIKDIYDGMVILNNNSLRAVVEVSSINFDLRSEDEQNALLQNFQQFLNSLDFSLQIVVASRKYDINEYIRYSEKSAEVISNELLRIQAGEYVKFIRELSELSNAMSKKFYIVVPYYVSDVGSASGAGGLLNLFKKSSAPAGTINTEQLATHKNQLMQRVTLISDGLVGMGVRTRVLDDKELQNLFFTLYNPGMKPAEQPQP